MMRQINEPIVVGSSPETYPDTFNRECCVNCGNADAYASHLDTTMQCTKHHRITYTWWRCSDYLSLTEAKLREEAYASLDKPRITLGKYLEQRKAL